MAQRLQPEKRTDVGDSRLRGIRARRRRLDASRSPAAGPNATSLDALAASARARRRRAIPRVPHRPPGGHGSRRPPDRPLPGRGARAHAARGDGGRPPVVAAGAAGHLDPLAGLDPRAAVRARRRRRRPAAHLRSLAADDAGRAALALAARTRQQRDFSLRAQVDGTDAVYRRRAVTDLVVVSLEAWDDVWRRNQHLVAGLLRADAALRVLFVEPPADPTHDLRSRRRPSLGHGVAEVPEVAPGRLWTVRPVKWLPRRFDRRCRRAARARGDAQRRIARHAASAALDQRPRRRAARRAHRLADPLRHHRRLALGRPVGRRARAGRGERGATARARRARSSCARPSWRAARARCTAGDAHPERRGCRRLPPADAAAGGPARRAGRPLRRHRAPRPHRCRPVRGDRARTGPAGTLVLVGPNLLAPDQARALAGRRALGCSARARATP